MFRIAAPRFLSFFLLQSQKALRSEFSLISTELLHNPLGDKNRSRLNASANANQLTVSFYSKPGYGFRSNFSFYPPSLIPVPTHRLLVTAAGAAMGGESIPLTLRLMVVSLVEILVMPRRDSLMEPPVILRLSPGRPLDLRLLVLVHRHRLVVVRLQFIIRVLVGRLKNRSVVQLPVDVVILLRRLLVSLGEGG